MYVDDTLLISDEQALTATAKSDYSVDLAVIGRDVGKGRQLYMVIVIDTAVAVADAAKTVIFTLCTDDLATLASPTTLLSTVAHLGSVLTAGRVPIVIPIPPGIAERYLGLTYTLSDTFTSFKVTAFVAVDVQTNL